MSTKKAEFQLYKKLFLSKLLGVKNDKIASVQARVRINATGLINPPDLCPEVRMVSYLLTTTTTPVKQLYVLKGHRSVN